MIEANEFGEFIDPVRKATEGMAKYFNTIEDKVFKKLIKLCGYDINYVLANHDEFTAYKTNWETGGYVIFAFYHNGRRLFEVFRRDELVETNFKGPNYTMKWVRREEYYIYDEQGVAKRVEIKLEDLED